MAVVDRINRKGAASKQSLIGPSAVRGPISSGRRNAFAGVTGITAPVDLYEITDGSGAGEGTYTVRIKPYGERGLRPSISGIGRVAVIRQVNGVTTPSAKPAMIGMKAPRDRSTGFAIGPAVVGTNDKLYVAVELRDQSTLKYQLEVDYVAPAVPSPNTALLLHFEGANGSQVFVDSGAYGLSITTLADAAISTTRSKIGNASGYFDGVGDGLEVSDPRLALGTGNFTIEAWVYPVYLPGTFPWKAICSFPDNTEDTGFYLLHNQPTSCVVAWFDGINSVTLGFDSEVALAYETWHHVAAVMSNGTLSLFANGVKHPTTYTGHSSLVGPVVMIGNDLWPEPFSGNIDELRIRKEVIYTDTFTPPTGPLN